MLESGKLGLVGACFEHLPLAFVVVGFVEGVEVLSAAASFAVAEFDSVEPVLAAFVSEPAVGPAVERNAISAGQTAWLFDS